MEMGNKKLMMRDRLSPFIRTSVETTVISDVGGSPVVRVEEEEDVGVETWVGHDGHTNERLKYGAPGLRTPELRYSNTLLNSNHVTLPWIRYYPLSEELQHHEGKVGDDKHGDDGES